MKKLEGRVAVVTGGGSGIGLGLARRFAERGMRVVLADIEAEALESAETELRGRGAEVLARQVDVADPEQVEALARDVDRTFGCTHILCNNAGVGGDFRKTWEQTLEGWEWVLGVNLWGVIHGIRSFVPRMLAGGDEGHIVNTASMAGVISFPQGAPYQASKHAVVTLSESLYFELSEEQSKLGVSVLCPGYTRTHIADGDRNRPQALQNEEPRSPSEERWIENIRRALAQGMEPEAVADCVLDAIRDSHFYVFPDEVWLEAVSHRFERVLSQRPPSWKIPDGALTP